MNPTSSNHYPIVSGEQVPLKVVLTPNGKQVTRSIYGIFDESVKRVVYVGKAGPEFRKRVATYQSNLNKVARDENSEVPNARLLTAMVQRPHDFHFSILKKATESESLSALEAEAIEAHETNKENIGYNSNKGGGGGSAIGSPSRPAGKRLFTEIDPKEYTPKKNYSVAENNDGRVAPLFSPTTKKKSCVIYRIRQISTNMSYIGKTETSLSERFSRHFYLVNTATQKPELHQLIKSNPEDFDCGILYECSQDEDIDAVENAFIKALRAEGLSFNKRNGGGGGYASSRSLVFS